MPSIAMSVDGGFCNLPEQQSAAVLLRASSSSSACSALKLHAALAMARRYGSYLQRQVWQLGVNDSNVHAWLSKGTMERGCYEQALQYLLQLFTLQVQLDGFQAAAAVQLYHMWISSRTSVLADAALHQEWGAFRTPLRSLLQQQGCSAAPTLALQQPLSGGQLPALSAGSSW